MEALLHETRQALNVLYGDPSAQVTRQLRRAAERQLLALRKAEPATAMNVCVSLLGEGNPAAATFAAQTVAHLCRFREPETTWGAALLGLLHGALTAGHSKAVLTQLSLAVCALTARKRAWAAPELIGAVVQHLHAPASPSALVAALRLLALLPEEMHSDQLALSADHIFELADELQRGAAPALVDLCTRALVSAPAEQPPALAAASLHCLSSWVSSGLVSWPVLAPALSAAMQATAAPLSGGSAALTEERVEQLTAGCALLTAAAGANDETEIVEAIITATLSMRGAFTESCAAAASAGAAGTAPAPHALAAAAALAALYADVGSCYGEHAARYGDLLDVLLTATGHACAEVALPALGFWCRAGRVVLSSHPAATQPLLAALVGACEYPTDVGARDAADWEQLEEVRATALRVVSAALVSSSDAGETDERDEGSQVGAHAAPPAAVLEACGWLLTAAASQAQALTASPDPLNVPPSGPPPSPPPSNDPLQWRQLEACLHLLGALAPALASPEPAARQVTLSPAATSLIGALPVLPARRALWREAALTASALGLVLDPVQQAPLLTACCSAAARTLNVDEADESGDEPFAFGLIGADAVVVHAGASALWQLCSGSAAVAAQLAASPGVFDAIVQAHVACASATDGSSEGRPKAICLLKVLCVLARCSDPSISDQRLQLLCAPITTSMRAALASVVPPPPGGGGAPIPAAPPAAAAAVVATMLGQLTTIARHGGRVQPGVLGVLASEWSTIRNASLAFALEARATHAVCHLLSAALTSCDGAVRALIEAAAQLSTELTRAAVSRQRPPPCVLEPLTSAILRIYVPSEGAAAAGSGSTPAAAAVATDATLDGGVTTWLESSLSAFLPSLSTPSTPTGSGADDETPIDLTDDDDEAIGAVCRLLSACVLSAAPRLVDVAAAAAFPLLIGSAGGLRVTEREPCRAALALTRHLLSATPATHPTIHRMLHHEGGGAALALGLFNAAGGAMPAYLLDDVARACGEIYTAQPEAGPGWVTAAVHHPSFAHPMVTGPGVVVPTGGNRGSILSNYTMVLGYLASSRAWEPFATVLARGVAVSEAEDQEVDEDEGGA